MSTEDEVFSVVSVVSFGWAGYALFASMEAGAVLLGMALIYGIRHILKSRARKQGFVYSVLNS